MRTHLNVANSKTTTTHHHPFFAATPISRPSRVCRVRAYEDDEPALLVDDWRNFRAKLVDTERKETGETPWALRRIEANLNILQQQNPALAAEESLWAHPTAAAETGGLLVATTAATVDGLLPEELWQAVIFLLKVEADGAEGIVLNRPTGLTMARLPLIVESTGRPSTLCTAFPQERVYFGGRTGQESVCMLHGYSALKGDEDIAPLPGVFLTGKSDSFEAASSAVQEHRMPAGGFRFFCGRVTWGPGQLEQEVRNGAWHSAACGRAVVLKQCLTLPVPLWVEVMRLMGDEYDEEARLCYPDL